MYKYIDVDLDTCRLPLQGGQHLSIKLHGVPEKYTQYIFKYGRWGGGGGRVGLEAVEKWKCLHGREMNLSAPIVQDVTWSLY
jgi:hypothetical protein